MLIKAFVCSSVQVCGFWENMDTHFGSQLPDMEQMLWKVAMDNPRQWPKWLSPLVFTVCEVPQASTGFSPFELMFGSKLCGLEC